MLAISYELSYEAEKETHKSEIKYIPEKLLFPQNSCYNEYNR